MLLLESIFCVKGNPQKMRVLQEGQPILFNLINTVGELPEEFFKPLILHLKNIMNEPYLNSDFVIETFQEDDDGLSL